MIAITVHKTEEGGPKAPFLVSHGGRGRSQARRSVRPIVRLQALSTARLAAGEDYSLADLTEGCAIATNIAPAAGDAGLMTIG